MPAPTTLILRGVGSTAPILLLEAPRGYPSNDQVQLYPGIIVNLSPGASMTYTVEVTGDYTPSSSGIWNGFDDMIGLTTSANGSLYGWVMAIRCTVTAYTSGTLTFQVIQ